jgi:nucleoid DNA-binding protein/predicted NAD-dependent protein-ADP-ribosyltransferase YbiA (DUF1768 family)
MENLEQLESKILDLLGKHNCVTVPGLGSFIYREFQASSNHFTFELKPSGNTIFFNNAILADDGILANAIREQNGLSYAAALDFIQNCVQQIQSHLNEKRNLPFGKLGNFFHNAENQTFFLPGAQLNLSATAFGLPIIKLDELAKAQPNRVEQANIEVVEKTAEIVDAPEYEDAEVLGIEEPPRNRGLVWKIAAGFAVISLSGAAWYFGKQYFQHKHKPQQTESALDVVTKPEDGVQESTNPTIAEQTAAIKKVVKRIKTEPEKEAKLATAVKINQPAEVKALIISSADYKNTIAQRAGRFWVVGGTFMGEDLAKGECKKWNAAGANATVFKPQNSALCRVVLGRFDSEKAASDFIQTMPGYHGSSVSVREITFLK